MKLREFLSEIEKMKSAGLVTDESEVLTYVDEFSEVVPYEKSNISLVSVMSNTQTFIEDYEAKVHRCRRRIARAKTAEETEDQIANLQHELDDAMKKLDMLKTGSWRDAVVV